MHVPRSFAAVALAAVLMLCAATARSQSVQTTTVSGTIYQAGGAPASGTLQISWPAFTTAAGQAVAAGRTSATIGPNGNVSVALAPNIGAMPAGLFYTAVYHLSDGTTSTEYWVVPNTIQATIGQVRSTVMPATQAVQAVNKAYVDQSIAQAVSSQITPSGGTLTGPLYLAGDPVQPAQAANKHYVDAATSQLLPLSGGVLAGPVTAPQIGAVLQADQFPGADFGAQLQACVNALDPAYGGTCDARNFTGQLTMASNLTLAVPNVTIYLPCSTIATAASIVVPAGTRNVSLHGCASRGTSAASGAQGGTVLLYSGSSALLQVGDPSFAADTKGFRLDSAALNTTAATSAAAQAMAFYRTQEISLGSLYMLGNANQTGLTLDGTGNYTGGTFEDMQFTGFQTAVNGIGHTVANPATTDWLNASTFLRVHIDCPTQNGSPVPGTVGINLLAGDGNTFTGGDVESCSTALHLGASAQNNTIVGLRNENSTTQVQADAGSSYNNWMTGGTMFTGKLVDQGTRNSFLDTFHRAFNGMTGDWYGSQQDATVTNHFRLGIGTGSERGLLNRYQTDYGYRWTTGLSDASAGIQYYQVLDELNNVYRLSMGQYNNGQGSTNNQTVVNAAGTGAVILNGSNNAGTGGVVFGSGGPASTTVATVDHAGNANFTGTLQVAGTTQSTGTLTVRNNADAEVDYFLWPGVTSSQKGSFTYKDFNGSSQWYLLKDQNNNWALNSAVGGLDSFKAYQSTNSGDTYINAAKTTGHIRLNYETGAGTETDIYSGGSSALAAAFLGPTAIKFPGLAAVGGKSCLQIDNSGYITNTGVGCGTATAAGTAGVTFSDGSVQTTSEQGALTGQANDATARTAAGTAETDAQAGITNAAKAEADAQTGITDAATAEADAQTGITNAAAAQTSANSALNGQANDATARTAAAAAETDAQTGITNAAKAEADAQTGITNAAKAEADAQAGITNAAKAEADAQTGITNAATAEADAQTGITNAAAAQTSADSALNGQANDATARTAAATADADAQTGITNAAKAEADAQTGITNAAAAQTSANSALNGQANDATARTAAAAAETDAQTGITNAVTAEADAQTGITNAAAAQTSANSALNGQANDAAARTAAAAAETDAQTGITNAAKAEADAQAGITNAAKAEADAQTGITNAATAEADAQTGITAAAAAQSSANSALNGQANDATARTAAAAAETDAQTGITNAAKAETDAQAGITNAAKAEADAQTGITNAAAAEADAQTGITNAAAAQTSANSALNGQANDATARTAAAAAETDAQTGITNAAKAEADAQMGITNAAKAEADAQTGITNAATAEADAQTGITNAAAAQTGANSALNGQANDATARTAAAAAETDAQTGITNAAKAETDAQTGITNAATAEADAQTGITAAAAAQTSANSALNGQANDATARTAAATAETDAQTGITNAAKAETDAQTGISNAATAETDAQTGITNAAAAQTSADSANSAAATAQTKANQAEADAQTGITNAAKAEADAQTGISNAATAEADAQTGITNAAAAQSSADTAASTANAALAAVGGTSSGSGSSNAVTFPGTVTVGGANATVMADLAAADSRTPGNQAPNLQTLRRDRGHVCAEDYLWVDTAHAGTDIGAAFTAAVQQNPLNSLSQVALCRRGTYTAYTPLLIDRPTDFDGSGSKILYGLPAGTQVTVSNATLTAGSNVVTVSAGLPAGLAAGMRIGGTGTGPGNYVLCVYPKGACSTLAANQFELARPAALTTAGIVTVGSTSVTYLRNTQGLVTGQTFTWQGQSTPVAITFNSANQASHSLTLASAAVAQGSNPTVLSLAAGNTINSSLYAVQATPVVMAVRNGNSSANQDGYNEGLRIHGLTIADPLAYSFDSSNKFPLFPNVAGEEGVLVSGWDWFRIDNLRFDGVGGSIITIGGPDQVIPSSTYGYAANSMNWNTDYPAREGLIEDISARSCGDWKSHQACIEVSTPAQASLFTDEDNGITFGAGNIDYPSAEGVWIGSYRSLDFQLLGPRYVHTSGQFHVEGGSGIRGETGAPNPYDLVYVTEGQDIHFSGAQFVAPGQGRYAIRCGACSTTVSVLGGVMNVYGNPVSYTVQLTNGSSTATYVSGGAGKFNPSGIWDDQGVILQDGAGCTSSSPCVAWLAPSGSVSADGTTLQLAGPWTGASTTTGTLIRGYGGGYFLQEGHNGVNGGAENVQILNNGYYDNAGSNLGALLMGSSSKQAPSTPGYYTPSLDTDIRGYRSLVYNNFNIQGGVNLNGTTQVKGGMNTVYRCTSAGALPVGALTTVAANCGASASTSFQVP